MLYAKHVTQFRGTVNRVVSPLGVSWEEWVVRFFLGNGC